MEDGNRLPHLNRRTDRCGCSHRNSRYSRNTGSPHNMPHHNPHIRHRCRAHSPTFHRSYREGSHRRRHSTPQDTPEAYSFDKDDESDRELLRNDPYAEYIDFPEEYRVRDEAQMELVCC